MAGGTIKHLDYRQAATDFQIVSEWLLETHFKVKYGVPIDIGMTEMLDRLESGLAILGLGLTGIRADEAEAIIRQFYPGRTELLARLAELATKIQPPPYQKAAENAKRVIADREALLRASDEPFLGSRMSAAVDPDLEDPEP